MPTEEKPSPAEMPTEEKQSPTGMPMEEKPSPAGMPTEKKPSPAGIPAEKKSTPASGACAPAFSAKTAERVAEILSGGLGIVRDEAAIDEALSALEQLKREKQSGRQEQPTWQNQAERSGRSNQRSQCGQPGQTDQPNQTEHSKQPGRQAQSGQSGHEAVSDTETDRILLGEAMLLSARARRESRGAHCRSDYPDRNDAEYQKKTVAVLEDGKIRIFFREIPGLA